MAGPIFHEHPESEGAFVECMFGEQLGYLPPFHTRDEWEQTRVQTIYGYSARESKVLLALLTSKSQKDLQHLCPTAQQLAGLVAPATWLASFAPHVPFATWPSKYSDALKTLKA